MRKATLLLCAGMLLSATSARAEMAGEGGKEYGKAGVIDLGATFSAGSTTTEYDDAGESDETLVILSPTVAYFLIDGLALVSQITVGLVNQEEGAAKVDATLFGLGLGAAYLMDLGALHVGPALLLQYDTLSADFDLGPGFKGTLTESGTGGTVAVVGKVPVGGGGLINLSLYYTQRMIDQDIKIGPASAKDSGTDSTIGTSVGFSVYF